MLKMQKKRVCWNITTKCNQISKEKHQNLGVKVKVIA